MFCEKEFFSKIIPASGRVILGDGITNLAIKGVGTVRCLLDNQELTIENVRYVPELPESIYSLFLHVQCPDHALQSTFEDGLFISFPGVTTKAIIGDHDIYLNMTPLNISQGGNILNQSDPLPILALPDDMVCRNIKKFQSELQAETEYIDNLLSEL